VSIRYRACNAIVTFLALFPYRFFHFSGLESRVKSRANTGDSNMTELGYEPPPPKKPVKRQYFVLTHAGKPVFTDRTEEEADTGSEEVTNLIGVMHALISVFEDDQDKIRCIHNCPLLRYLGH
jgi:hypothetical protein